MCAYEKQARRTLDLASRENKALGPVVKRVQRSVPIHPDVLKEADVPHPKDYTVKESVRLEKVVNENQITSFPRVLFRRIVPDTALCAALFFPIYVC